MEKIQSKNNISKQNYKFKQYSKNVIDSYARPF